MPQTFEAEQRQRFLLACSQARSLLALLPSSDGLAASQAIWDSALLQVQAAIDSLVLEHVPAAAAIGFTAAELAERCAKLASTDEQAGPVGAGVADPNPAADSATARVISQTLQSAELSAFWQAWSGRLTPVAAPSKPASAVIASSAAATSPQPLSPHHAAADCQQVANRWLQSLETLNELLLSLAQEC